jgi:hypothetical protein
MTTITSGLVSHLGCHGGLGGLGVGFGLFGFFLLPFSEFSSSQDNANTEGIGAEAACVQGREILNREFRPCWVREGGLRRRGGGLLRRPGATLESPHVTSECMFHLREIDSPSMGFAAVPRRRRLRGGRFRAAAGWDASFFRKEPLRSGKPFIPNKRPSEKGPERSRNEVATNPYRTAIEPRTKWRGTQASDTDSRFCSGCVSLFRLIGGLGMKIWYGFANSLRAVG